MTLHAAHLILLMIQGAIRVLELLRKQQVYHGSAEQVGVEQKSLEFLQRKAVRLATQQHHQGYRLTAVVARRTRQGTHPLQVLARGVVRRYFQPIEDHRFARVKQLAQESVIQERQAVDFSPGVDCFPPKRRSGDTIPGRLEVPATDGNQAIALPQQVGLPAEEIYQTLRVVLD